MKVLLSAYACAPEAGSEPGVGFRTLTTVAQEHEVWLLTRANNISALTKHLDSSGLHDKVHLTGFDVSGRAMVRKKRGLISLHRYYDTWQRAASSRALELHDRVGFDIVHHVTFASYWTRAGVASVPAPLVWGPVGGAVRAPLALLPVLGPRGVFEELARSVGRELTAAFVGSWKTARLATVVLAQNAETERQLTKMGAEPLIIPNATSVEVSPTGSLRTTDVFFVGRLIRWKAGMLALSAFRYVEHPEARLIVVGDGPDRRRMERAASAWNIQDRVRFEGRIPRSELVARLSVAGALLHPALHDESPLTVAEALMLGTPVVCLNWGGPSTLTSLWPSSKATSIAPTTRYTTARRMASAVDDYLADPPDVPSSSKRPVVDFETELLTAYSLARDRAQGG